MRHRREQRPAIGFRANELRWMAMGVTTLVVLGLLIATLREPGGSDSLGDVGQAAAQTQPAPPASPLPKATGPTDEDRDQAKKARDEFPALSDGTTTIGQEEMAPYNRLVSWVTNQSFARLWARAKKNLAYTYLYDEPTKYRGKLVALDVTICLAREAQKNDYGVLLNEAWATTAESRGRLYGLVVVDFPPEMPVERFIREKARFVGYFLKIQGYESGVARPGQRPERAPMLIGRLEWTPAAATSAGDIAREWIWVAGGLGALVVMWAALWGVGRLRGHTSPASRSILSPASNAVIPVEQWLEQSRLNSHDDRDDADEEKDR